MELSILCDLKMFVFIYDQSQRRVIHYASDPNQDFCEIFNEENQREFYSNKDVSIMGQNHICYADFLTPYLIFDQKFYVKCKI